MCREEGGSGDWHRTLMTSSGQVGNDKESSMKMQNALKPRGRKEGRAGVTMTILRYSRTIPYCA